MSKPGKPLHDAWLKQIPDAVPVVPNAQLLDLKDPSRAKQREESGALVVRQMAFVVQLQRAVEEVTRSELENWRSYRAAYWEALRPEVREELISKGVSCEIPDSEEEREQLDKEGFMRSESWWMKTVLGPMVGASRRTEYMKPRELTQEEKAKLAEAIIKSHER